MCLQSTWCPKFNRVESIDMYTGMHTPFHRRKSRLEEGPTMTLIKIELYNSSSHHSESQMANKTLMNWEESLRCDCHNNTTTVSLTSSWTISPSKKNLKKSPKPPMIFLAESMHLDQIDRKSHRTHSDDEPQISRSPVQGPKVQPVIHVTRLRKGNNPPKFNTSLPPTKSPGSLLKGVAHHHVVPFSGERTSRGEFEGCQNVKPYKYQTKNPTILTSNWITVSKDWKWNFKNHHWRFTVIWS